MDTTKHEVDNFLLEMENMINNGVVPLESDNATSELGSQKTEGSWNKSGQTIPYTSSHKVKYKKTSKSLKWIPTQIQQRERKSRQWAIDELQTFSEAYEKLLLTCEVTSVHCF
jgi:hypothetical protein